VIALENARKTTFPVAVMNPIAYADRRSFAFMAFGVFMVLHCVFGRTK
jgi:hypothetical protein